MRQLIVVGMVVAVLASACGGEAGPEATSTSDASAMTTSSSTPESGRKTLEVDGVSRTYELFVPPGHDPDQAAPLVVVAHGGRSSVSTIVRRSDFDALAAEEGIVVVYPGGDNGIWDLEDGAEMDRPEVDDVQFVSALIDEISELVAIDEDRVYAAGFSQGFGLAAMMACHMPDRVAAVVAVAGLIHLDGPACPEPQPARILALAGEADPFTTEGSPNLPFVDLPGPLVDEVEAWTATNGCHPTPEETALSDEVTHRRYSCAGGAALEVYLHPGTHDWPAEMGPGIETNEIIWEFLSRFAGPLP